MDNKILNLNGKTKKQFDIAMQFAFTDDYDKELKAVSYMITPKSGLVFYYIKNDKTIDLPCEMNHIDASNMAWSWLKSANRIDVAPSPWCTDMPHDGHNSAGWQIYLGEYDGNGDYDPNWGHVEKQWFALCAIKPAYCWYGK